MVETVVAAALLSGAALFLGQALCVLCRGTTAWYGGGIGLALLLIVTRTAIRLPGHATTSVVITALLTIAAAVLLFRRRALRVPAEGAIVGGAAFLVALIPFVANGRFGLLGVGFNNDTSLHLLWADGLRSDLIRSLSPSPGSYPLGPHAIVATIAQAIGTDVATGFTALLIVVGVLTALAARAALGELAAPLRVIVAVLASIAYLAASYYVEGAFKETIVAGLLVTFAVALADLRPERGAWRQAVLLGVTAAGMLYAYSYTGLAWPVAAAVVWLALDLGITLVGDGWPSARARARRFAPIVGVALLAGVIAIAPEAHDAFSFLRASGGVGSASSGGIAATNLGNLVGPLSVFQAFGVWLGPDFRIKPSGDPFNTGAWSAVAAVAVAFGTIALLRRRQLALPAALIGGALIYLRSKQVGDSPYVTAKALVVVAPLAITVVGAGLWRVPAGVARWSEVDIARIALVGVFTVVAALSSLSALRGASVAPREHEGELASLRPFLHRSPTLFLGYDDYFAWELRDVPASAPVVGGPIEVGVRSEKPWSYGQPFDFDSIQPQTLDRFTYVITSRTSAQSEPPSNFRLVRQTPSFMVWKRTGRTVPRDTLPGEKGAPGAILDCKDKAQRALTKRKGVARVEPAPVGISGPPGPMLPGTSTSLPLRLPPGRWSLSMPYLGPQAVTVRMPGLTATLPPNLDRPGPLYSLGQVTIPDAGDPMRVTVSIHDSAPSRHLESALQIGYVGNIIAVRPGGERTIPLSQACGRYVDWYRLDDQAA